MANLRHFLLDYNFKLMNEGYSESASETLGIISEFLSEGIPLPIEVNNFLAEALKEISCGTPPNKAFRLNGRK